MKNSSDLRSAKTIQLRRCKVSKMKKKTLNDLNMELNDLKSDFEKLRGNFDDLTKKLDTLEKLHEKCSVMKVKKFKCNKCEEEFDDKDDLKQHRLNNHNTRGIFKCDLCDWEFSEEWKYDVHVKTCGSNSCDQCEEFFQTSKTLKMHVKIAHEEVRIFCHYFNNEKDCPFEEDCIYIHEKTSQCRYGDACERTLCMFQHKENENCNCGHPCSCGNEDDTSDNDEVEECNKTFVNPSLLSDLSESVKM